MNSHRPGAALILIAAASLSSIVGCVAQPESAEGPAEATEQALATPTCVTLQRGTEGLVADAKLRSDQPGTNFGALPTFVTGAQSTDRASLLRFAMNAIPAGQDIVSATVTLHEVSNLGPSTIDVHAVTAPWSEGAVTWGNFGSAYAPVAATSFSNGGAGHTGAVSFDLTPLARSFYADPASNNGIALVAPTDSTWASSEATAAATRPALDVCYRPAAPPVVLTSALVQANDGGGWLAYASCGIFHLYVLDGTAAGSANILNNADDTLSLTLADGTHTLGLLGTDGNNPGATQRLDLSFGGVNLSIDETPGSTATALVGSKIVTISSFAFTIPTDAGYSPLDRVAVCGVYPDGYVDSYGRFTVTVTPAP
jgi:hypothetical protein